MRVRLLLPALALASAALLPPGVAVADESAPSKGGASPAPGVAASSPLRAAVEAASEPRKPVSGALVVAGGITASIGAAGALAGLLLMHVEGASCAGRPCGAGQQDAGRAALFIGAPVLAAGLVMVVVGIQPATDPDAARVAGARLVPTLALGPTGGSLRWSF